jgi:hypothetical protein
MGALALGCASNTSEDVTTSPAPGALSPSTPASPDPSSAPATSLPPDRAASPPPAVTQPSASPAPDNAPAPAAQRCDSSVSFDQLYASMQRDLSREDAEDSAFLRYISLANRLNQGACPEELAADRLALIKAVNSVSTEPNIALPLPVGPEGVLQRIDLRDLGWDEPVVVDGVAFADKWEAIIAASEFAVEFEGDDADDVKLDANTLVPMLNADALIDAALLGNLYYGLLGIGESEDELLEQLGIDEEAQEEQKVVIRAGTSQSRLSRQATVAERLELEDRPGYYWARYDLADASQGQSIFVDPLGFQEDGIGALFSLPNGLNGYVLFDAAGVRQAETAVFGDASQLDGLARNSVSCSGCHAAGLNPILDEVRAYAAANSRDFDADTLGEIEDSFLAQAEVDAVLERDLQLYQSALARVGLDPLTVDPVYTVYQRFDADVNVATAAGDLGLTPSELSDELGFLSRQVDPQLSVLRSGTLPREGFEQLYLATLCALSLSGENRPAAAGCAAVGQ